MTQDDWIKIIGGIVGGGFLGAIYTNWRTDRRNKIQPIGRRINVSYVNLPKLLHGFKPTITLKSSEGWPNDGAYNFEELAIIQIELKNIGNADIKKFDLGINIPEENQIIGVQENSDDRYHKLTYTPEVTIAAPTSQLDCIIEPFNRKDVYTLTLLVNAKEKNIDGKVKLSKTLSIKFVDPDSKDLLNYRFLLFTIFISFVGILLALFTEKNQKEQILFIVMMGILLLLSTFAYIKFYLLQKKSDLEK